MRDPPAVSGGDPVSLPSPAEVEHAEWPALKQMCESLGLNPKGRSAVVRMRVLDHVRRHARPEPWRAGREHIAALLTRLGFPELSEDVWESTIQLDAPAPWLGLGQAQLAGGSLTEAAKSFDRAVRMGDAAALLHRAEVSAAGGEYERAVRDCESYAATHAGDIRALAMRADLLGRAGFAEEATRVFRSAAESRREIPGLLRAGGTALLRSGRPEAAIDMLTEAIRVEPTDNDSRINLGAALVIAGRTREAIAAFREALEIDPGRSEALNNLGVAQLRLGQSKSALKSLERAAKLADSPRILLNLEKIRGTDLGRERSRRVPRKKSSGGPQAESDRPATRSQSRTPRKARKR
jgi:tetratricopeptide (TPR) repeat protein